MRIFLFLQSLRLLKVYILPLVVAISLLLLVRCCFVTHYEVQTALPELSLQEGDRLLVGRYVSAGMKRGTIVAFRHPSTARVELARIIARPGDSLWVDNQQQRVSFLKRAGMENSFMVPGHCEPVDVQPQSARLLYYVLRHYEKARAVQIVGKRLLIGGVPTTRLHFSQNYYWLENVGLLPESFILGPALCITYSSRNWQPRWNRFLRPL